jgi:hypothetical protein
MKYDVFLSHRYAEKRQVQKLNDYLESVLKYNVYVDWIDSRELDRTKVNRKTADYLRETMRQCKCLLYFYIEQGENPASIWMPWELGFFDGRQDSKRVAIFVPDAKNIKTKKQEYLELYEVVDYNNIEHFLNNATKEEDLADFSRVDYDRYLARLRKLNKNPTDFYLSTLQWYFGVCANSLKEINEYLISTQPRTTKELATPLAKLSIECLKSMQANIKEIRNFTMKEAEDHSGIQTFFNSWLSGQINKPLIENDIMKETTKENNLITE